MGRAHLAYVAMLGFVLVGIAPLEVFLRVGVYRRWRRLLLTMLPVFPLFLLWDVYAIARGQWHFDAAQTTGVVLPGGVPLEELLFFLVVPLAAVATLEAVRVVRGWPAGDEPAEVDKPLTGDDLTGDDLTGDDPAGEDPSGEPGR